MTEATELLSVAMHELERMKPQIGRMEQVARNAKRLFR
jgi:DNA repair ATPase RecN